MNFTNTDCVGKNWSRYKAFSRFTWQVPNQVDKQDCVLKNWRVYESLWDTATTQVYVHVENKVHKHVKWEVDEQVHLQVKWEVDAQPNPFKTKIKQEINK